MFIRSKCSGEYSTVRSGILLHLVLKLICIKTVSLGSGCLSILNTIVDDQAALDIGTTRLASYP